MACYILNKNPTTFRKYYIFYCALFTKIHSSKRKCSWETYVNIGLQLHILYSVFKLISFQIFLYKLRYSEQILKVKNKRKHVNIYTYHQCMTRKRSCSLDIQLWELIVVCNRNSRRSSARRSSLTKLDHVLINADTPSRKPQQLLNVHDIITH